MPMTMSFQKGISSRYSTMSLRKNISIVIQLNISKTGVGVTFFVTMKLVW